VTAPPIDVAGRDGGPVRISPERLDELTARIEGRLLRPGDEGWDSSVLVWNALAARTPALVQPVSAHDVAVAVGFARDHGLLLSVKGGGHNIAGTSLADRGLTLDLARMRDVTVDAADRIVHVGPGCLLQDVDRATQRHGLATVLGIVSEVGVAGLTLGGGFGYLMRRFGWAVDNLHEVQIVTADGAIRTANRAINAELFWALRGGGGNFGVVTRFTFLLHPVGPTITGGLILWDAARAEEVLSAYRVLTESAPRELAAAVVIRIAPPAPFIPQHWHGRHIIGILVCHSGAGADADLTAVRALGDPIADLIAERPYIEQQSMMDGTEPKGQHYYWKAEHLPALSSRFLEAFRDGAMKVPTVHSESVIFHSGGAANEHAANDGAVGNRDARYIASTGGNYVNFQLAEDDTARTADAYGGNFERLRRAKGTYDPHNLFRVNRNITPTVPARSVDADPDDVLPSVTAAGT
jgi:FAD/FMN-containing dehydrogenase